MSTHLKILYVDDEADISTIVMLSLKLDPNIEVRTAGSGQEALTLIDKGQWLPDLALIDMMMPGMSGIELLAAFRERDSTLDLPVMFVTASARSTEVQRYVDAGAIGVISKPFDPITLAPLVRRHYEGRHLPRG